MTFRNVLHKLCLGEQQPWHKIDPELEKQPHYADVFQQIVTNLDDLVQCRKVTYYSPRCTMARVTVYNEIEKDKILTSFAYMDPSLCDEYSVFVRKEFMFSISE